MSPNSKNYLLIVLFLATVIASSIAWQQNIKIKELTAAAAPNARPAVANRGIQRTTVAPQGTTDLAVMDNSLPSMDQTGNANGGGGGRGGFGGGGNAGGGNPGGGGAGGAGGGRAGRGGGRAGRGGGGGGGG